MGTGPVFLVVLQKTLDGNFEQLSHLSERDCIRSPFDGEVPSDVIPCASVGERVEELASKGGVDGALLGVEVTPLLRLESFYHLCKSMAL